MAPTDPEESAASRLRRAVVKVLTVIDPPDYDQPWQTRGVMNVTGSGAIVKTTDGPRIVTNAHVVEGHVFVEVRRYGDARKFVADVVGMSTHADLALLRVDDEAFFQGIEPIPLGALPALGDRVTVLGFPIGGDRLSVTEGVVSRIEMTTYAQSQRNLLAIQIDAAINAGNSGGPVVRDGKLVGIAFQALEDAADIGYVIPASTVRHVLRDIQDGAMDGFPSLGVRIQTLESPPQRRSLGLDPNGDGVLVRHVEFEGSAWKRLTVGDVLLAADGVAVAPDGTIPFRGAERIEYLHLSAQREVGERMSVLVHRAGKRQEVELVLRRPRLLVSEDDATTKPRYFIFAGLLFVPLSRGYLETWGEDWTTRAPAPFVSLYESGKRSQRTQEVVVLQKVLADQLNRGYHDTESVAVERVQGRGVRSLAHLVNLVQKAEGEFVTFDLYDGRRVVIDRVVAVKRGAELLERYGVPRPRSARVRARAARSRARAPKKRGRGRKR